MLNRIGGAEAPWMLASRGPAADRIAELWWLLVIVATVVYLVVIGALAVALVRRREPGAAEPSVTAADVVAAGGRGTVVIVVGAILPAIIVIGLFVAAVRTLAVVAARPQTSALTIDVTGHQWWWDVEYRTGGTGRPLRTANEIHIPVGQPVRIRLISQDVIHSFWVPQLHGKLDLIPGKVNEIYLQADRPGIYRGQCAEYCGLQHARMALIVVGMPAVDFEAWLAREGREATMPTDAKAQQGLAVFVRQCSPCHTIRGTPAFFGREGPDLTHVASRRTLAGGMLDNVRGNLAGWIVNPQTLKPGNRMPDMRLPAEELHPLLQYLETLR